MPGTCEVNVEEEAKDKEERQVTAVSDTFERRKRIAAVRQHYVVKESAICFVREPEDITRGGFKKPRLI
jgi:hypothetical protein